MTENSKCAQCRREGTKLFLKGDRCFGTKCAIVKRNFAPGVHGPSANKRSKLTDYGKQLREKQAAKRSYVLRERQFSNYVAKAVKKRTNTEDHLIALLESRLDNVVYRLGYGVSRIAARQLVGHGFIFVNGKKVDIPSYQVDVGDIITINPTKVNRKLVNEVKERIKSKEVPGWLNLAKDKLEAKVLSVPKLEVAERGFDVKTIIEYYSR